jgi:hypothetical protein
LLLIWQTSVIGELRVNAPIETFGKGARGLNVYKGAVNAKTRLNKPPIARHANNPRPSMRM